MDPLAPGGYVRESAASNFKEVHSKWVFSKGNTMPLAVANVIQRKRNSQDVLTTEATVLFISPGHYGAPLPPPQ